MTERPILFNAPMVRAIPTGAKTQTRRVVKARSDKDMGPRCVLQPHEIAGEVNGGNYRNCPYGEPGDRLWVRETWYCDDYRVQRGPYLKPDDMDVAEAQCDGTLVYRASSGDHPYEAEQPIWRPSIHMPRWASRITLEVTDVRVERLQDISEADAQAEGVEPYRLPCHPGRESLRHVDGFVLLWNSLNPLANWCSNPWVWVVSFQRVGLCEADVAHAEGYKLAQAEALAAIRQGGT
jgi:hypothetical protein